METLVETYQNVELPEEVIEHEDSELAREIYNRKQKIETSETENKRLRKRLQDI